MKYVASLTIQTPISYSRLRALVEELKAVDCQVRLDHQSWRLEFDVPDDLYSWMRAGGLRRLLKSFSDIVASYPRFHEVADERKHLPRLPAPRRRERMRPQWKLLRKSTFT